MFNLQINILKFVSITLFSLLVTGCANMGNHLSGTVSQGVYLSPKHQFQVNVPYTIDKQTGKRTYLNARDAVTPKIIAVDFMENFPDWKTGYYSIEWAPHANTQSPRDFYKYVEGHAPAYVANNIRQFNPNMHIVGTLHTTVNHNAAFRTLARGTLNGVPAAWMITVINFKNAYGTAYFVTEDKAVNMQPYRAFIASLKSLY